MRSLRFIIWIRVGARIFAEKRAKMRVFYKKKIKISLKKFKKHVDFLKTL